ncbi:MAG: putative quinol monooxygenase [Anaerovoracaceae bacterium]|jgi:quinol monooxygenase YgiN
MKALIVTYKCHPGKRDAFLAAIKAEGIDRTSREEDGNLRYAYYYPIAAENDDDLLLLEQWRDEEAFQKHCSAAHFKRLGELKATYVRETVLEKYDA